MYCEYGCGQTSHYLLKNGKNCCSKRPAGCPEIKSKNSLATKRVYATGARPSAKEAYSSMSEDAKTRMNWNKDKYPNTVFEYGGTGSHKAVLIQERGHRCEACGLEEWQGHKVPLELEHIDGDNKNNIKENLKLLCCNCHALTDTWRGRNINSGKVKVSDDELLTALEECSSIRKALQKVGLTPKGGNYARANKLRARGEIGHTQET